LGKGVGRGCERVDRKDGRRGAPREGARLAFRATPRERMNSPGQLHEVGLRRLAFEHRRFPANELAGNNYTKSAFADWLSEHRRFSARGRDHSSLQMNWRATTHEVGLRRLPSSTDASLPMNWRATTTRSRWLSEHRRFSARGPGPQLPANELAGNNTRSRPSPTAFEHRRFPANELAGNNYAKSAFADWLSSTDASLQMNWRATTTRSWPSPTVAAPLARSR
jgi:hypothetical protein